MALTPEQIAFLDAPLDPKLIKTKPTTGSPKYLEGHEAMNNANRIFGHSGWGYTVDRIERMEAPGGVLYSALVSVTVEGCHTKQDIGVEIASNLKNGDAPDARAHDTAMKGAVTDGIKRALRSFGDQFGASLYDKDADLAAEYRDWQREQDQAPPVPDDADSKRRLAVQVQDLCAGRALEVPASYQDWSDLGASLGLPAITGKAQMSVEWLEQVKTRLEMRADDDKPIGHSTEFTRVRDALAAATTGADIVRLLDEDLDLHAVSRDEYEELERLAKARHDALAPEPAGAVGSAR